MRRFYLPWTYAYSASVAVLLAAFRFYPALIELFPGVLFTPWTIAAGALFVLRDYCQREIGHPVWIPMALGILLSWIFSPEYGLAVITGGFAGALTDWLVYTLTRKPFAQRVLFSSLVSGPADTFAFFLAFDLLNVLPGTSIFNLPTVLIGSLSKILAAVALYLMYRRRERSGESAVVSGGFVA